MAIADVLKRGASAPVRETADQVLAEIIKLAAAERDAGIVERTRTTELAELERAAGDELIAAQLDGRSPSRGPSGRIAAVRADIDTAHRTAEAARRQRIAAVPRYWRTQAAELHLQADAKRNEADKRLELQQDLLRRLETFEGCAYAPVLPNYDRARISVGGSPTVVMVPTPKTRLLQLEADDLDRNAAQLERKEVVLNGNAAATTVDELLDLVLADPLRVAPPIADILDWAERAADKERACRARIPLGHDGYVPTDAPMLMQLSWRGGAIVREQSDTTTAA